MVLLTLTILFAQIGWTEMGAMHALIATMLFLLMIKISKNYNHALILLLTLECLTLILFLTLVTSAMGLIASPLLMFTFLTLAVCEASVGLCLLVRGARFSGNDLVQI